MNSVSQFGHDDHSRPRTSLLLAREVVFAPLGDGRGLVEQVVRRLGEAIGLGLLELGDRLPPEAELAQRFGIAPMTLREALAILREAGYLETRRGRGGGTFVRQSAPQPQTRAARKYLARLTVEELRDLMDFRLAVSAASAALAAERATEDAVAELRDLVEKMAAAKKRFSVFRRLDSHFHIATAATTGSSRLVAAETSIQADLGILLRLIPESPEMLRVSNEQHRAVLEAIARHEPDAARAAIETHVRGTADFLIGLRLGQIASAQ